MVQGFCIKGLCSCQGLVFGGVSVCYAHSLCLSGPLCLMCQGPDINVHRQGGTTCLEHVCLKNDSTTFLAVGDGHRLVVILSNTRALLAALLFIELVRKLLRSTGACSESQLRPCCSQFLLATQMLQISFLPVSLLLTRQMRQSPEASAADEAQTSTPWSGVCKRFAATWRVCLVSRIG